MGCIAQLNPNLQIIMSSKLTLYISTFEKHKAGYFFLSLLALVICSPE